MKTTDDKLLALLRHINPCMKRVPPGVRELVTALKEHYAKECESLMTTNLKYAEHDHACQGCADAIRST